LAENSKSRVQADAAFLKTQTQSLSRNRIVSETDTINQARDANTARLKEQRLNKEALDRAAAAAAPPKAKARKSTKAS
jgi:BRCT domain type II-containing protein